MTTTTETAKGQNEQPLEQLIEKHKNSPLYNDMKSLYAVLEKMDNIQNEMMSAQNALISNIQEKMAKQIEEQKKSRGR